MNIYEYLTEHALLMGLLLHCIHAYRSKQVIHKLYDCFVNF